MIRLKTFVLCKTVCRGDAQPPRGDKRLPGYCDGLLFGQSILARSLFFEGGAGETFFCDYRILSRMCVDRYPDSVSGKDAKSMVLPRKIRLGVSAKGGKERPTE